MKRLALLALFAVPAALPAAETWADAFRRVDKKAAVEEKTTPPNARPEVGIEETSDREPVHSPERYNGTSNRGPEVYRDFKTARDKASREGRPVVLWIDLKAVPAVVAAMPGGVHCEVPASSVGGCSPRLAVVTRFKTDETFDCRYLSGERVTPKLASELWEEARTEIKQGTSSDYFASEPRKPVQTGFTLPPTESAVRINPIAFQVTPQMPAVGGAAPRYFPGSGPAYDPDHNCDRCGTPEYVQSGPGPAPGTHTHTCRRCGNVWFH